MSEISDEMVMAAAKAISPWAFQRETFIDKAGRYWASRHAHCREAALADGGAALEAVLPMVVEECAKIAEECEDAIWEAGDIVAAQGKDTRWHEAKYAAARAIASAIRARKQEADT